MSSCFIGLFDSFRECFNPRSITGGRDVHAAYYTNFLQRGSKLKGDASSGSLPTTAGNGSDSNSSSATGGARKK
ncbi:unnamed protein product [Amoebophrya sp. A25]|nr:unnamed protein product [Amoebophrya sp. A25]|eukprot:GSA25T00019318001.1